MLLSRQFVWIFRGAEWLVMLSWILSAFIYNQFKTTPHLLFAFVIFGISFFALSFIFPINSPLWQRRLYLYVQMGLLESQSSRMILNEKLSFERLPTTNLWAEMDKLGSTGPAL
jgi:hypothetical protein